MNAINDSLPFHADERAAHAMAGWPSPNAPIRASMPDQHRAFFAALPYLFATVTNTEGWPMATILTGAPGFVQAPSPTEIHVQAVPGSSDPAAAGFIAGHGIGLLGIDFATRRRNRANGRLSSVDTRGFAIDVTQSFGNCPQYIQTRALRPSAGPLGTQCEQIDGLDDAARAFIGASDTFFAASRSRAGAGAHGGLDMSHRGGLPGFIRVEGNTLFIPDFKGNRYFNTLGNLLGDPRCGLLFPDFETGDLLHARGTVSIDWDGHGDGLPPGAQRVWRAEIHQSWRRAAALPFTWDFGGYAPGSRAAGVW